jgi:hypothetical protein
MLDEEDMSEFTAFDKKFMANAAHEATEEEEEEEEEGMSGAKGRSRPT